LKRKYWLIFGVIQAIGIMAAFDGMLLQFPTILIVSLLFLLPGSLASVAVSWGVHDGADWSPWTLGSIAVITNVLLFTITSFLLARYRKSKRVSREA
jgi:hypothetical protein